jgi:hypothetical protein
MLADIMLTETVLADTAPGHSSPPAVPAPTRLVSRRHVDLLRVSSALCSA